MDIQVILKNMLYIFPIYHGHEVSTNFKGIRHTTLSYFFVETINSIYSMLQLGHQFLAKHTRPEEHRQPKINCLQRGALLLVCI
jgi:hypothetical protein